MDATPDPMGKPSEKSEPANGAVAPAQVGREKPRPDQRIAIVASLAELAMSVTARAATLNGNSMMNKWAASDRCAPAAQKGFPDFTVESRRAMPSATR